MKEIIWEDIRYICYYDQQDYWMKFKIYELTGTTDSGKPLYGMTFEEKPDEVFCEGEVKWDGCSNFTFSETTMIHTCGKEDMINIGIMLGRVFDLAKTE